MRRIDKEKENASPPRGFAQAGTDRRGRPAFATAMVLIGLFILSLLIAGMYLISHTEEESARIKHVDTQVKLKLDETAERVRADIITQNETRFSSGVGYIRSAGTAGGRLTQFDDDFILKKDDKEYRIVVEVYDVNSTNGTLADAPSGAIVHPDPAFRERKRFSLGPDGNIVGN